MFQLKNIIDGKLNDLPKELSDLIPVFKNDDVVRVRTLPHNLAHVNIETGEKELIYEKVSITLEDTITFEGNRYRIGVPKEFDDRGQAKSFKTLLPYHDEFSSGDKYFGSFTLQMSNREHQEIYTTLWLIDNYGGSRNNYYAGGKLFEIVDNKKETAKIVKQNDDMFNALSIIRDWSEEELKSFAASMGLDSEREYNDVKVDVDRIAVSSPEQFNKFFSDPLRNEKSIFKRAESLKLISFDAHTNQLSWVSGGVVIETFKNVGEDWVTQAANYAKKGGGEKLFKQLEKAVKSHNKKDITES